MDVLLGQRQECHRNAYAAHVPATLTRRASSALRTYRLSEHDASRNETSARADLFLAGGSVARQFPLIASYGTTYETASGGQGRSDCQRA